MFKPLDGSYHMIQVPPTDKLLELYLKTNPKAKKKIKGTRQYFETNKKKSK